MNRVLGDYMEKMLYKIFVSIDEQTQISEVRILYICHYIRNWEKRYFVKIDKVESRDVGSIQKLEVTCIQGHAHMQKWHYGS